MSGSSSLGFLSESLRSIRVLATCLSALVIHVGISDEAAGQLRSGRTERSFYQDQLSARRPGGEASGQTSAQSAVTTASYAEDSYSIIENPIIENSSIVSEPCTGCDGGCDSCLSDAYFDQGAGCGVAGCNAFGCDTCSGGYSPIAPTCTSVCPPGCGPLMALWYRLSVRAEVPLFWRRDQGAPVLVTSADAGTPPAVAGQIGQNSTNILLGGGTLTSDSEAGVRLTFGTWLGQDKCYGVMFRYWNAGDQDDAYNFSSNSFPILARPFLNTTVSGAADDDTQLVAYPGESVGNIGVTSESSVQGLELSIRRLLYMDRFTRVDWIYGYQHVSIDEGLTISSNTSVIGNSTGLQGATIAVMDRFQTENDFHGVSYGIMSTRQFACWKMETMFRLGAGNLRRKVRIAGTTTTTASGTTVNESQGLLARDTNNQEFVDDTFVVVPELAINFAYRIRPGLDFNAGYNYMVIPKVAQAAQQIDKDLAVNLSDPLVGALDPALDFTERQYWLHSLGLGVQLRY